MEGSLGREQGRAPVVASAQGVVGQGWALKETGGVSSSWAQGLYAAMKQGLLPSRLGLALLEAEGAGRPSPCTGTPRGVGRGCGQKMAYRTRWIPRHPQAVLGSQCSRGPAWDPRVRGWAEVGGCPSFLRRAGGTRGGSRARGGPPTCLGRCRAPNRSFPPRREQKWSSLSSAR